MEVDSGLAAGNCVFWSASATRGDSRRRKEGTRTRRSSRSTYQAGARTAFHTSCYHAQGRSAGVWDGGMADKGRVWWTNQYCGKLSLWASHDSCHSRSRSRGLRPSFWALTGVCRLVKAGRLWRDAAKPPTSADDVLVGRPWPDLVRWCGMPSGRHGLGGPRRDTGPEGNGRAVTPASPLTAGWRPRPGAVATQRLRAPAAL